MRLKNSRNDALSSHPSPVRFILPTWATNAADASHNASALPKPPGRTLPNVNVSELGDSEGTRRRIDAIRGVSVLARAKTCGNGFNTFEGIGWLMDGVKRVGRSYLGRWSLNARKAEGWDTPPDAHEENLVPLHGDSPLVLEDVRKPE